MVNFNPTLENWAKQGVLLLNSALTVEKGKPGSHSDMWKGFTKQVLKTICEYNSGVIFVLMGKKAQEFKKVIPEEFHHIIEVAHPAAECYNTDPSKTAGFIGSKIFTRINEKLNLMNGKEGEINWIK